jgi:hypothetical protein
MVRRSLGFTSAAHTLEGRRKGTAERADACLRNVLRLDFMK